MIGLAILGCAQRPHVRLEAPARQASAETRLVTYDRALRRRLDLCVSGFQMTSCR